MSLAMIIDTPSLNSRYKGTDIPLPEVCRGFLQARRYFPLRSGLSPFQVINCYFKSGGAFSFNKNVITPLLSPERLPSYAVT